ncbi:MAG: trigger factor [SAR324 cluster bacterium]|nr:trigger factor [SAR324 cluster bacterium]
MDIEFKKLTDLNCQIIVNISKDEIAKNYQKKLILKQKDIKLDGFRKGKVPTVMIEKMLKDSLLENTKKDLIAKSMEVAEEKHKIEYAYQPEFQMDDLDIDKDFSFTAIFETVPHIEILNIDKFALEKYETKIDDKEVNLKLKELELEFTKYEKTTNEIKDYDRVYAVIQGFLGDHIFHNDKGEEKYFSVGIGYVFDEIETQIKGLKTDDEKSINYTFAKDFNDPRLAGKTVIYKIKINKIMSPQPIKWSKDIFNRISPDITDEAGLKKYLGDYLLALENNRIFKKQQSSLREYLLGALDFKIPHKIFADGVDRLKKSNNEYNALSEGLAKAVSDNIDKFKIKFTEEMTEEVVTIPNAKKRISELNAKFDKQALQENKLRYYVSHIVKEQKYTPRHDMIRNSFSEVTTSLKLNPENFIKSPLGQQFYNNIVADDLENQALTWHLDNNNKHKSSSS